MAAVLAPNPILLRRRTFRDGTLLLANQAANLINVPAARNIARELRALAASLKCQVDANQPRILQAPGVNDEHAQEQAIDIQHYADFIETIAEGMSRLEGIQYNETIAKFWILLQQFDDYLSSAVKELQVLQYQSVTVKFACQIEITRRLDAKKEETLNRVILFCLCYRAESSRPSAIHGLDESPSRARDA
ncbi:hypothetical protein FRC07_000505 [Ceratobasidium sp. 392]|nr:hypothetical protein FRC07_000505 [Ceratobasidium sp. 392]